VVKKEITNGKFNDIKAGMVNASFEQQAVKLVTDKATRERWAEKYSRAKIISTDWEIEKDEYTIKTAHSGLAQAGLMCFV